MFDDLITNSDIDQIRYNEMFQSTVSVTLFNELDIAINFYFFNSVQNLMRSKTVTFFPILPRAKATTFNQTNSFFIFQENFKNKENIHKFLKDWEVLTGQQQENVWKKETM